MIFNIDIVYRNIIYHGLRLLTAVGLCSCSFFFCACAWRHIDYWIILNIAYAVRKCCFCQISTVLQFLQSALSFHLFKCTYTLFKTVDMCTCIYSLFPVSVLTADWPFTRHKVCYIFIKEWERNNQEFVCYPDTWWK